jgi:hypothetical protein
MKHNFKLVIFCLALAVFLSSCSKSNPLNGVWTGKLDNKDVTLVFLDDAFIFLEGEGEESFLDYLNYTYIKAKNILITDFGELPVAVKGNNLTLRFFKDEASVAYTKDKKTAKAPASINGVWTGPRPWVFAFVNDKVFILDMEGDPDYANYTFTGNSGSFKTYYFETQVNFTVKDKTLITTGDVESTFTKNKKNTFKSSEAGEEDDGHVTGSASDSDMPEWINDLPPDDVIWGIGIAKMADASMSLTVSEQRAMVSIARQLNNVVEIMFAEYEAEVAGNPPVKEYVYRQVTNANITGAKPIKRWMSPDGALWTLAEYPKSDAKKSVGDIIDNQTVDAKFDTKKALEMLDKALSKPEKPVQTGN